MIITFYYLSRVTLNASLSIQEDIHLLNYEPGDHIGLFAPNRKEYVDFILSRVNNAPDQNDLFKIEILKEIKSVLGVSKQWINDERFPITTLKFALTYLLDLTTPVSQYILMLFSTQATDENDQIKLKTLSKNSLAYAQWKKSYPNLVELLEEFPSLRPDACLLVSQLPKLHARVYSISSFSTSLLDPIDITVSLIEYQVENKSTHYGVFSKWLESLPNKSIIPAFIRGYIILV